jgi:hypothetical protein
MFLSVFSSVLRFYEVGAGLVLGLFGMLCAALAMLATIRTFQRGTSDFVMVGVVGLLLVLAAGCGITAFRLLSGRGRDLDGGLFPPWFLRILGLGFLVALVWFSIPNEIPVTLIGRMLVIVMSAILGIGCFYLANRQQRAAQRMQPTQNDT